MKSQNGFTLMTVSEFEDWISRQHVTRKITVIQEHHTYSPSYKLFNGSNHFALQNGMKSYHVSIGYANIAQNLTIFPDGLVMTGRPMNTAPAGCVGANSTGICIENVGNFDRGGDTMTDAQKTAIVRVTAALLKKFNLTAAKGVTYHCWWTADGKSLGDYGERSCKTCPGTRFFGGNTRASFEMNFMPLVEAAMRGEQTMTNEELRKIIREEIAQYFKDLRKQPVDAWAENAFQQATDAGILDGTAPCAPLLREEFALVLQRTGQIGNK